MKLFRKTILGLSLALFATQPVQAGMFSRVADFTKKHNTITSNLASFTTSIGTYYILKSALKTSLWGTLLSKSDDNIGKFFASVMILAPWLILEKGIKHIIPSLVVGYITYKKVNEFLK